MDICLVYMPYGLIEPPPLGVALLVAEAKQAAGRFGEKGWALAAIAEFIGSRRN